jgi:RNA polymerase sigma-70 factor (ECF subfamily)
MELALRPGLGLAIPAKVETTVSPEVALVRRAQSGDEAAFRQIVEKYQSKVFSIIHGILRNRNDVEDIAQQVFTKVYFALKNFDFRSSLVTWIYKITVNECYDYLRKQKVRKLVYEADLSEDEVRRVENTDDSLQPAAAPADKTAELRQYVTLLMERLSEDERALLMLKEVEGYSVEELAGMYQMNENTVKVKLFRARQKLVRSVKKNPALRTGAAPA